MHVEMMMYFLFVTHAYNFKRIFNALLNMHAIYAQMCYALSFKLYLTNYFLWIFGEINFNI